MATSIKRKTASTDVKQVRQRRSFSQEFKLEAVQMLLDGHSAVSVAVVTSIEKGARAA